VAVGGIGVGIGVAGGPPPVSPLYIGVWGGAKQGVNATTEIFPEKK